jgi:hypothetical protein
VSFSLEITIAIAIGAALIAALFAYFAKIRKLPPRLALLRAIELAYEIWQASDFAMPKALTDKNATARVLREAGLVLKAEVIGQSTFAGGLRPEVSRPHPELIGVDPLALARGVAGVILEAGDHE